MSKLCKFSYRGATLLIDPDSVIRVNEDRSDCTCKLCFADGQCRWVEGNIDEVMSILNLARS